ncbi:spermidine/putrescine ABC transporter [Meridianimarinicoccus roseus]|jgi:spermidine/putrescine transport system permease protein|uniref:Spermidine/putrescine ABC transporter n=1 Tax=Meridianimarinicoccus roseus TaxID=2072018 RepID=A0A2V2LNU9_9RHOB|nr:ABC transporter permease [Meridianimarinicoccus roseus]PWR04667.1 spermidine/putrescine ABC transporter [Meridianimarinicoccus roseus]
MRGLRIYTLLYLAFLYLPIVLLPIFAFNDSTVIAFPLAGFTTQWFTELADIPALHAAVLTSLKIALVTAAVSTLLGICAARAAARYRFPAKGGIMGLVMLPLVLPEIIVAVSLLVVFLQLGLQLSALTVILGHVLICTPFCIAILNGAFQSLDNALEEAAVDLGETGWGAFRLVILPLVMPGIVASMLIAFTISMDEFIIAFFLSGTEATLPVYLWGQLRFPQRLPAVMALGTILVAASVILLTIAELARRRGVRKRGDTDTGGFL